MLQEQAERLGIEVGLTQEDDVPQTVRTALELEVTDDGWPLLPLDYNESDRNSTVHNRFKADLLRTFFTLSLRESD